MVSACLLPATLFGRRLLFAVAALLLFRFWLAVALPITGDEAYFVVWGERPAGGYYDHPPMIGWWLAGLLSVARSSWWLRLPAILLPCLLAWGVWWLVRPKGAERAGAAALLTLLQPVDVWNVLITSDTPVILFSFLSVLAYVQGMRRQSLLWHALAGLLLGLAFLSKYFAALLGFAFAVHLLFVRSDKGRWQGFLLLTAVALLAPAYNLWWNSGHCWSNILFNFFNRNSRAGFNWRNPLLFLASVLYLATPWAIWSLWTERRAVRTAASGSERGAVLCLLAVPLLLFFVMSFGKTIGLHWLLAFMPLLAVLAASSLSLPRLQSLIRWSVWLAAAHVLLFVVLLNLPLSLWQGSSLYSGLILTLRTDTIVQHLKEPLARCGHACVLAMESYSSAATLAYAAERPVSVFGDGSFHGRQDDFDTDMRQLDGRDFLILRKETVRRETYQPYFDEVDVSSFVVEGVTFHVIHGRGFRYALYHEQVLTDVRRHYYRIPSWLPQRACVFNERYFPGAEN